MIGIHDPFFSETEHATIRSTLDSGWVSTQGPRVKEFEFKLQKFLGTPHAPLATTNGSAALHLAMHLVDHEPGDHVLVSDFGFVATANAAIHQGMSPILIGPASATDPCVSLDQVQRFFSDFVTEDQKYRPTGRKIRGILFNEPFGFIANRMQEMVAFFHAKGLFFLEDASQAFGMKSGPTNTSAGTFGDFGIFSFNGNKTITCGSGGALVCKSDKMRARAQHLASQARVPGFDFQFSDHGYNFLLSDLSASLGCAQMTKLSEILERKSLVTQWYGEFLKKSKWQPLGGTAVAPFWLNIILHPKPVSRDILEALAKYLHREGFVVRPAFIPLSELPPFSKYPLHESEFSNYFFKHGICVPSGAGVTKDQVEAFVVALHSAKDFS